VRKPLPKVSPHKYPAEDQTIRGLGDIVHLAAQPIARILDHHLRTDIQHCAACAKRRQTLNHLLPFHSSPSPSSSSTDR
jgi:hypothetical protein